MVGSITSLLASGALGAILKIASALFQHWQENKKLHAQIEAAKFMAHKDATLEIGKAFYGESPEADMFTRGTRRVISVMFVGTFCAVLLLWAWYPAVEIVIYQPTDPSKVSFLFGLFSYEVRGDHRLSVTTGALVWAGLHPLTMILTAYYMPVGRA